MVAIGGNKLARGLTLDGLSVNYFLRCSKMYDTLMQMGRWFGYRPGYLDLCRLYTTKELSDWFAHIAVATEELRDEFDLMANSGGTPKDFGLRVLSHPTMMVTSAVKMRHGRELPISFQGSLCQTIDFRRKEDTLKRNWNAARTLIEKTEERGVAPIAPRSNAAMWSEVPGDLIVEFLGDYKEHKAARTVRTKELGDYIEKQMKVGGLTKWTVLLSGGSIGHRQAHLGSAEVRLVHRPWYLNRRGAKQELIDADHYRIKVLTSSADELVDLGKPDLRKALDLDIMDWEIGGRIRNGKTVDKPDKPGGRFARKVRVRSQGLLILYPLVPDDDKAEKNDTPILGFAISFPCVEALGDTPISYVVNNVFQRQEMHLDD